MELLPYAIAVGAIVVTGGLVWRVASWILFERRIIALAARLQYARTDFFASCVGFVEKLPESEPDSFVGGARIVNTELGGQAEVALKAYQLYMVENMINNRAYLPKRQRPKFMGRLRWEVCQTQLLPVLACLLERCLPDAKDSLVGTFGMPNVSGLPFDLAIWMCPADEGIAMRLAVLLHVLLPHLCGMTGMFTAYELAGEKEAVRVGKVFTR